MKIFAISDLHLSVADEKPMDIFGQTWSDYLQKIKDSWSSCVGNDDIVLLCGDLSWAMKLEEIGAALELLAEMPGKKIIIRGNHDYWWKSISSVRAALPQGCYAIQNDALKIGNVVFCGTRGWSVEENKPLSPEDEKIFQREGLRFEMSLAHAKSLAEPCDKIVALLHYPPFNSKRETSLFVELAEKYGVSAVVYGHLHGKNVNKKLIYQKNGVTYYLTSCDQVDNKLVEINI